MATISTAIRVQDGFTGALRSMSSALQTTLNSFEQVQRASGRAVDTSSIQAARSALARTEQSFNAIEREIMRANTQQRNFNDSINEGYGSANRLLKVVSSLAATYLSFQGVKTLVGESDAYASAAHQIGEINDGLRTNAELQDVIRASAQKTYTPYKDLVGFAYSLSNNAADAFNGTDEILRFAELLNESFAIAKTPAEQVASATLQLTQALGSGVLRGEELNAVLEAAPSIVQNIEKRLGLTRAELRDLASDGEISAQVVKDSLFAAADDIDAKFQGLSVPFANLFIAAKDRILYAFDDLFLKINQGFNGERFQNILNGITSAAYILAAALNFVYDVGASVFNFIYDNWGLLGPLIIGISVAVGLFTTYLVLAKLATLAWAGAQMILNSVLLANPIGIAILIIIALIAAIYIVIDVINQWAGATISATGVIVGALAAALAFIGNLFIAAQNLIIDVFVNIYNTIQKVAEFVANVFIEPVNSVKRLFFDLLDSVLGVVKSIAGAIDTVTGSSLADSIGNVQSKISTSVESKIGAPKIQLPRLNADNLKGQRFNYGDSYNSGYNAGSNLAGNVKSAFSLPDLSAGNALKAVTDNMDKAINQGEAAKDAKKTKKNTKKIADKTSILADDLQYLKDIAERDAINRYTTGEIVIDMSGMTNEINNGMDLDGIVDGLVERLEEAVDSVAEGSLV